MLKLLLWIFVGSIGFGAAPKKEKHPLYVSITDFEWNSKEQSIEITSKIFLDDFEGVLKKNYNQKVDLYATQNDATRSVMIDYFKKNLILYLDGKAVNFSIVGYEKQKEACWCYFEVKNVPSVQTISCTNSLLYDYTDKQINLMHATVGGKTKSTKLNYPDKQASFNF